MGDARSLAGTIQQHRGLSIEAKVKTPPLRFHYHNFFRAIPDIVIVVDAAGTILDCNQLAVSSLGLPRESVVGRSFYSFISSASLDLVEKALDHLNTQETREIELTLGRNDDRETPSVVSLQGELPALLRITPISKARKGKRIFILILKDLTDQRRTQLQLIRFANAIHFTVNPIEITDISGKIIYVNPAFERISGYRKEELLGRNPGVLSSGLHDKSFWTG